MFQRIIVPLDGTPWSEKAVETGAGIAEKFGASLLLLHAYKGEDRSLRDIAMIQSQPDGGAVVDPHLYTSVIEASREDKAHSSAYLDSLAEPLRTRGINVETRVVDASATDAIMSEVNRDAGTLVVMCSHGRAGLGRLFGGNIAEDLLHKSYVPLLLLRHPDMGTSTVGTSNVNGSTEGDGMAIDVTIGAQVMGTGGKLGEVHRVIVDARSSHITDMVVKHGFVFGNERVVPLSHVTRVEDGIVYVDLDAAHFEIMNGFADDRYRAPDPSYIGPPGFDNTHFLLDSMVAGGGTGGLATGGQPLGYPGGEQLSPDDMGRPTIAVGTPVVDMNGERIGEVGSISVSSPDGMPTHIVLRQGHIFHHNVELPMAWVDELSDKGVTLKVAKAQIESMGKEEKH